MQKIAVLTYIFLTVNIAKADTIVPASLINRPAPNFAASAGNIEGYVKMRFSIGLDGSVINPVIIESKPARIFDKAAIDAVGRWTYHARTVNGRSVEQADNLIILRFKPDLEPEQIYSPPLYYPRPAYEAKIKGSVKLKFDVTALGTATNIEVVDSTPPGIFDREATNNLEGWMFRPPQINNVLQSTYNFTTTIQFDLKDAMMRPTPNNIVRPLYPEEARTRGIMGYCIVNFGSSRMVQ